MWSILRKASAARRVENTYCVFKETKRLAGHSKWSNIRHIKAEKDGERSLLFAKFSRQMRVAIAEEGSCKPAHNARLARIIEVAKKKSMPVATINSILERAAAATITSETASIDVRGPGGCIIIVEVVTDNMAGLKMLLNGVFKKQRATATDQSVRKVFDYKGHVVTELMGDLDSATDDAIAVGAEDVEEIDMDGQKYLQFTCEGTVTPKVVNKLSSRNYKIISSEGKYVPLVYANLNEEDLKRVEILFSKLEAFDEVVQIHDNIA